MRNIHEAAAIVRAKNARNVERAGRRRNGVKPFILRGITAAAILGSVLLAANMQYRPWEIVVFLGCLGWETVYMTKM